MADQIIKISTISGPKVNPAVIEGIFIADTEQWRLDMRRIIGRGSLRRVADWKMEVKNYHPGGAWEHNDEVENY